MKTLTTIIAVLFFLMSGVLVEHAIATNLVPDSGQTQSFTDTFGEDADYIINPPSYTKLDENGNELPDSATEWVMVRDNVTGLIWEVKTDDDTIHDKDDAYTWQNAQDVFIPVLNTANFGGFDDWRLPNREELHSLVNYGRYYPSIDTFYFPNTISSSYWTSDSASFNSDYYWRVYFNYGEVLFRHKLFKLSVRAVRGNRASHSFINNGDGTVTNTGMGLMWQYPGTSTKMTWEEALNYCENLSLAGHTDWRMPNIKELSALVNTGRYSSSFYLSPERNSYYWSSTTDVFTSKRLGAGYAYSIYTPYSNVDQIHKLRSFYVWAVRGGQSESDDDSDNDGIRDTEDNCPDIYNPDQINSDDDSHSDACDNCPDTPNPDQEDTDGDRIGDACDDCIDVDADGACDEEDNCPSDPNKIEPGICGCGVAETDSDNDGTPDCNDNCPNDPDKVEPGICGCDTPDTDSDSDGTPDCNDNCPDSNLEETIIIDGCDSGVENQLFDDGCTMSDLIAECNADNAENHGKFVSCVSHLTNDWKKDGLINGKEKGAIQSCAAQSDLPSDPCPQREITVSGKITCDDYYYPSGPIYITTEVGYGGEEILCRDEIENLNEDDDYECIISANYLNTTVNVSAFWDRDNSKEDQSSPPNTIGDYFGQHGGRAYSFQLECVNDNINIDINNKVTAFILGEITVTCEECTSERIHVDVFDAEIPSLDHFVSIPTKLSSCNDTEYGNLILNVEPGNPVWVTGTWDKDGSGPAPTPGDCNGRYPGAIIIPEDRIITGINFELDSIWE